VPWYPRKLVDSSLVMGHPMLVNWIIDHWYLCVDCRHCRAQFAFQRADDPIPDCLLNLTCRDCLVADYYGPVDFMRVQAHETSQLLSEYLASKVL